MIFTVFILMRLAQEVQPGCCTQDKGVFKQFNSAIDPNFQCLNGMTYAGQISFYCKFANVPQIIIASLSYEYEKHAQFQFKILTTTTKEWTFQIQCFSPTDKLLKYEFTWIAADDNRLYVVNDYMDSTILVDGYISQTIPHPNSNGNIISKSTIVSYFGGAADTSVYYPTGNSAWFQVWKGTSGLGIQIILGWADCLFLQDTQLLVYVNRPSIQVAVLPNSNYTPLIFQHAWYVQALSSEIESDSKSLNFISNPQTDGTIIINAEFIGSGSAYFYEMSYIVLTGIVYEPLYFKKMRITKKLSLDSKEFDVIWQLNFSELKQIYTDPQSVNYDGNFQTLTLIYNYNCQPNKKIVGSVLRCTDCQQQYLNFTQFCYRKLNLMTIRLNLLQTIDVAGTLQFKINNEGFLIQQAIQKTSLCNELNTYLLVQLDVQNT